MNIEEIEIKLSEMGYCVEEIFEYFPSGDIDLDDMPDKVIMVTLCDGAHSVFQVFGDELRLEPKSDNDDLPF